MGKQRVADVKYKTVLLGRHGAAADAQDEPTPLSYLDCRNQDALRAWRERSTRGAPETVTARKRSWLAAFGWADSAGLLR